MTCRSGRAGCCVGQHVGGGSGVHGNPPPRSVAGGESRAGYTRTCLLEYDRRGEGDHWRKEREQAEAGYGTLASAAAEVQRRRCAAGRLARPHRAASGECRAGLHTGRARARRNAEEGSEAHAEVVRGFVRTFYING